MPKKAMTPEEIQAMKNRILDHALELLGQKGFDGLTMRGVARSMGVSSGTLYVYYENRDELYLAVLTKGFERLHENCRAALEGVAAPMDRLKALATAYLDFGMQDSHFYNLMFTWHVPKFQDYFGTPMEAAASRELEVSQEFYNFALQPIREIMEVAGVPASESRARSHMVLFWSLLHGYIAGLNNTLLSYMHEDPLSLRETVLQNLFRHIEREMAESSTK
ncbi:transcriptional regulator, TetR family [Desulfatibacillum alkenivorans DSM 16219]|jgi:AcrR family transcriptional regulator|uniref:Transcriptional regulator, TetR family n=1 Tax=Desulfatibacillum alkenivorans DSM 16219 TaxID=1121393 RepID=A0A1M6MNH3_9BACT|nr:TetR/AcrR family transcriptional regulator [Desulfatibacillum alkenivorans]SHJ84920.1 transcriptional regulator, TetR family [Desulfatibacillum alkenivorans DSM 16219]